jgi:hypothetical protein
LIPSRRQSFNREFQPAKYRRFLDLFEQRFNEAPQFRHSETPCFFPSELIERMARSGREIVVELLGNAQYLAESERAIPAQWRVPNEAPVPLFVQADFGLDQDLQPKLVEIQGFPSLYAYQPVMSEAYREAYQIDPGLALFPNGLAFEEYRRLLGEAIVGRHDPEHVVLLEIDPASQKTRHDFVMTERMFGVRSVDIRAVHQQGKQLYYDHEGVRIPIRRIYNRAIVDELERRAITLPFDIRDDLDIEWAGHPNWFFRLSKFSLPYLKHESVPPTRFLSDVETVDHPERYVLKPLFSFAGAGVIVGPTAEQISAVPASRRADYILQERVDFRPVIETPAGAAKVEVRIMYLWLGDMRPVNTVIRMGRGAQMGVDHNKGLEWVGASAAFIEEA